MVKKSLILYGGDSLFQKLAISGKTLMIVLRTRPFHGLRAGDQATIGSDPRPISDRPLSNLSFNPLKSKENAFQRRTDTLSYQTIKLF